MNFTSGSNLKALSFALIEDIFGIVIVGSGSLEKFLKELVCKLKLEKCVIFIPHIHDEIKLNKVYNLGDLLVLPQVPGTVSIQAMACGLPVVTLRNKSGLLAAVDERILNNFVFFNSDNPEEISKTCYDLFKNPEILNSISQKGLKIITDYSWQNISIKLIKFLESLID